MSQPNRGWRTSTFVVATITGGGIGYVIARTSPVCRRPASGVRPLGTQCVSGERGTMAASPMARAVARQELFDARSHTAIAHLAEGPGWRWAAALVCEDADGAAEEFEHATLQGMSIPGECLVLEAPAVG